MELKSWYINTFLMRTRNRAKKANKILNYKWNDRIRNRTSESKKKTGCKTAIYLIFAYHTRAKQHIGMPNNISFQLNDFEWNAAFNKWITSNIILIFSQTFPIKFARVKWRARIEKKKFPVREYFHSDCSYGDRQRSSRISIASKVIVFIDWSKLSARIFFLFCFLMFCDTNGNEKVLNPYTHIPWHQLHTQDISSCGWKISVDRFIHYCAYTQMSKEK